jgi:hypothetical protein
MSTPVNINRQTILYAERDFDFEDLPSGVATPMIYLPAGSKVLRGGVDIVTAFDSGTSDTLTVGDTEGVGDADRYDSAIDAQAAALSTFGAVAGGTIDTAEAITLTNTAVGTAATAGAGTLWIEYVVDNRTTELHAYRG